MMEIRILEGIALLFLFLSISRPLIKGLWPLEGLVWLPFLSLGITLGLYPAYGFRPETLPLVFFEILLVFFNLPAMGATLVLRPNDAYRDRSPFFTLSVLFFCAAAGVFALVFAPKTPAIPPGEVRTLAVRDESRDRDYFLRIYRPSGGSRPLPLLFVIPPEAGSVSSIDGICAGLQNRGFTVISYSRRNFDFPAPGTGGRNYFCSPAQVYRLWTAFRSGFKYQKANDRGKALETARMEDIEFLLPHVILNRGEGTLPLVMAGYGSGGSALAYLADSPGFGAGGVPVRGIIAVEPGFWRSCRAEDAPPAVVPAGASWFAQARVEMQNRFAGLKARQVSPSGPAPRPSVPALYLVSSRAADPGPRGDRYRGVYAALDAATQPAALVYLAGAGPLDYTGHPLANPVYSALFPGSRGSSGSRGGEDDGGLELKGQDLVNAAAAIIGNFSALLADAPPQGGEPIPGLHIETRSWNLPDLRGILTW
jgi:hypothetical protein